MNAKSTKTTGTKKTSLQKAQARNASRQAKLKVKAAGKPKAEPAVLPICPACKSTDVVVTTHGQSCSKCGHNEPNDAKVSPEQKVANAAGEALAQTPASGKNGKRLPWRERAAVINAENNEKFAAGQAANPLTTAHGSAFTDALNAATVAQLEEALKHLGLSNQQRNRVGIALKLRTTPRPADDIAKTVDAVTKGDLAKGIEVPTASKKKPAAKAARPEGKMSGLDAAAKVLADSAEPLNAKQIVEAMAAKGYWSSTAATPHATIYAAMIVEIAKKGDQARFRKTDRGLFTVTDAGKQGK